ncbi:CHASE3 domain-containing protein [Methylobacterium sp. Leaf108]|uniref:CHASE3 domain-containing protein n=1 Tax=Methylobacterium sp. Leaf108 TaxID=1736256 RepID=UPI0009E982E6|nr:CHASE3 domain-containing protein [Methylobacterium sp. Leaf108]
MTHDDTLPPVEAIGAVPHESRLRGVAPVVAILGLLVAVVVTSAALVSGQARNSAELRRVIDLRRDLTDVFSGLQDAETGQRGYLLTGNPAYLTPYEQAIGGIGRRLASISGAVDAPMRPDVARLSALADAKLAELRESVGLYADGRIGDALDLVRTDRGKAVMDEIRSSSDRLYAANDQIAVDRQRTAGSAAAWLQATVAAAIVLVVLLGAFVLSEARRRQRSMAQAQAALAQANRALVSTAARRDVLEEQLRQAQKMEALGQLTGGMAHDFNNMLAIVIGNLCLMRRRVEGGEIRIERYIDHALEGAERAATLTRRLLAFARRQPLQPEPLACNRLIATLAELVRGSLGETIHIETVLAGGLWQTMADASQLESAIVNLTVNARDAMPEGGRLTIETANAHLDEAYAQSHTDVAPGQYVLIAVTDDGSGMDPEVADRAVDPFFTTKAVGRGTGLGLSQVYGFVKQSGGHLKIYSEAGYGTTVKIYLPRLVGLDRDGPDPMANAAAPLPAGSPQEIILVVEDEDDVRRVAVEALRDLNYTVIHAYCAAGALTLLDSHPTVSLLFTDVVMPDLDGRRLAEAARRKRPDLRVLYTSGYSRNAIVHNGIVDADVRLLGKPYTLEQLATKVRQAIMDRAA